MSELRLEPFAVEQRWHLPGPQPGAAWQALLSAYVASLAAACAAYDNPGGPAPIIGHIKLLALFPEQGYLRISAVSTTHPVTCTGSVPDGLAELALTLNVLVYGIPRGALHAMTHAAASALAIAHAGQVTEIAIPDDTDLDGPATHSGREHSHHDHSH